MTRPARVIALVLLVASGLVVATARHAGTALVVSEPVTAPDAIVSLASHEWERLPETARLAAHYPASRVLLTLPARVSSVNCHDCAGRIARLVRLGVDAGRIDVLPLTAPGTHGEALACRRYAQEAGVRQLLVITSPYHTRRSLATFREVLADVGVHVGVQPASATSPADPAHWWRSPHDRWYVSYEWLAVVFYAVRYGVDPS